MHTVRLLHHVNSQGDVPMQSVGGNSAKSGLKPGDTIIYTSSWFGDELWPADSPAFVNTALARAPSPVYITYVRGANEEINVRSSLRCLCESFCNCRSLSWHMAQPSRDGIDATLTSM
jgi:hypothetical protein